MAMAFNVAAQVKTVRNHELIIVQYEGLSKPLRDAADAVITDKNPPAEHELTGESKSYPVENTNGFPIGYDPALQPLYKNIPGSTSTSSTLLSNWDGLRATVNPSGNTLAVGPYNVMQMTNDVNGALIRIWDKDGGVQVNSKTVKALTGIEVYGEPNVLYDPLSNRFVFVVMYPQATKKLLVCVSQTLDPNGAWHMYSFTSKTDIPAGPKISLWEESYLITTWTSAGPNIFALYRKPMLFGRSDFSVQQFSLLNFPGVGLQPAAVMTQTGVKPAPAGLPALIVRVEDDAWHATPGPDYLESFQLNLDWINPASSTITGPYKLITAPFKTRLCETGMLCIPQRDSPVKLNALSQQIMDKIQYRNFGDFESVVCTHTVNVDGIGKSGLRWYELRRNGAGDWIIHQQGTYSYNAESRFLGGISINGKGSIALGYATSSAKTSPGLRITGRDSCDIANAMTVPEMMVEITNGASPSERYSDYSSMLSDPADNSFWFSANYIAGSSWATAITHFSFSSCPAKNYPGMHEGISSADMMIRKLRLSLNPNSTEVAIAFESYGDMRIPVRMTDLAGHVMLETTYDARMGNNVAHFKIDKVANGAYFIKVGADGAAVQRMTVLRSSE
jgi:hypothetical protein